MKSLLVVWASVLVLGSVAALLLLDTPTALAAIIGALVVSALGAAPVVVGAWGERLPRDPDEHARQARVIRRERSSSSDEGTDA